MPDDMKGLYSASAASAADVLLGCHLGSSASRRVQHKPDLQELSKDLLWPPALQACCQGMVTLDRDCGQSLRMATLIEARSGTVTGSTGPPQTMAGGMVEQILSQACDLRPAEMAGSIQMTEPEVGSVKEADTAQDTGRLTAETGPDNQQPH